MTPPSYGHLHDLATIEQDKRLREALLMSARSHADSMELLGGWVSGVRLRDSAIDADTGTRELVDDDSRAERLLADLVRKGLVEQRVSRDAKREKKRGQKWVIGHFEFRITEKGMRLLRHHEPVDPDIADDREEVFE